MSELILGKARGVQVPEGRVWEVVGGESAIKPLQKKYSDVRTREKRIGKPFGYHLSQVKMDFTID